MLTSANSYSIPDVFRFPGLYTLGCIIFLFNLLLFIFNTIIISIRFYFWPETFKASFLHPTESLFIPSVIISIGTIFVNITQYGVGDKTGAWLSHGMAARRPPVDCDRTGSLGRIAGSRAAMAIGGVVQIGVV